MDRGKGGREDDEDWCEVLADTNWEAAESEAPLGGGMEVSPADARAAGKYTHAWSVPMPLEVSVLPKSEMVSTATLSHSPSATSASFKTLRPQLARGILSFSVEPRSWWLSKPFSCA